MSCSGLFLKLNHRQAKKPSNLSQDHIIEGKSSLLKLSLKGWIRAIAGLLMYDITNRNSFNNISKWLDETKNYAKDTIVLCLVGNKSDLEGIY